MEGLIATLVIALAGALMFAVLATKGEKRKEKQIREMYDQLAAKSAEINSLRQRLADTQTALDTCQANI